MTQRTGSGRSLVAALLVVVGAVLLPLGVLATWSQRTLLDTDAYTAAVAPLAQDPVVQEAVAAQVTEGVLDAARSNPVLATVLAPGGALDEAVSGQVEQLVLRAVRSPLFAPVWEQVHRRLHVGLLAAARGEPGEAVRLDGDALILDTTVLLSAVQDRLAESIPVLAAVDLSAFGRDVVVAQDPALGRADAYVGLVDSLSPWLLPLAILALAAGVLLAHHRPRMLVVVGALVAVGAGVFAVLAAAGERAVLTALRQFVLRPAADAEVAVLTDLAQEWARPLLLCGLGLAAVGGAIWFVRARASAS